MNLELLQNLVYISQNPNGRPFASDFHLSYALIGGLFLELSNQNKIKIVNDRLELVDITHDSNTVVNEVLQKIRESKKPRKISYWIQRLARQGKRLKKSLLIRLEQEGKILIENKKFLYIFPYQKIHVKDTSTRMNLVERLKHAILMKTDFNEKDTALLGLVEACKMHKVFTSNREELKTIKKELKILIKENPIAKDLDKAIQEVQAAIMVTITTSAAVNASINS